jgi:hypothetical protein
MPSSNLRRLWQDTRSILFPFGRTLGARVADRVEDVSNFGNGFFQRNSGRRIPARDVKGALAGVRVGTVLHPAVFLAFADGAGFLQHRDRPCVSTGAKDSPA